MSSNKSFSEEQTVIQKKPDSTNEEEEQRRILKIFLAEFQWKEKRQKEQQLKNSEPVFFWEFICVKDYTETIRNVFNLSFLLNDESIFIFVRQNKN